MLLETMIKNLIHLLQGLNPLFEVLCAASFLGKLTFPNELSSLHNWHAVDHCHDVILRHVPVVVKIVDLKHKLNLLVES